MDALDETKSTKLPETRALSDDASDDDTQQESQPLNGHSNAFNQ